MESKLVPSTFPAYHGLLLGDDGVLWIHDYVRPGERSEWYAFDPGWKMGRASLILPPRTELLDIGPDWALVRTLDEQDVQRLAVHILVEN